MKLLTIQKYFFNCFLLAVPILLWNLIFANKLPVVFQSEIFWNNIPVFIACGENVSRIIMFIFMLLMPLQISTNLQKKGFALYVIGVFLYFASWIGLMYFPNSIWSIGVFGFLAPAYTPLFWLIGIGLIGDSFYFNLSFKRWFFIGSSIIFLLFHNTHAAIIYSRMH
jgi:hypothetical protein